MLQVCNKAPEFMSPNVWRKPESKLQHKHTGTAPMTAEGADSDDCQIIDEVPPTAAQQQTSAQLNEQVSSSFRCLSEGGSPVSSDSRKVKIVLVVVFVFTRAELSRVVNYSKLDSVDKRAAGKEARVTEKNF